MEMVTRNFEAKCGKETNDIVVLVESLSLGLVRDAKDGLDLTEIVANLTMNIGKVSEAVEGGTEVGGEISAEKVAHMDFFAKWGADFGIKLYEAISALKEEKAEEVQA